MVKINFYELNTIEDNKLLFVDIPDNLTYPLIQPFLHRKVLEILKDI